MDNVSAGSLDLLLRSTHPFMLAITIVTSNHLESFYQHHPQTTTRHYTYAPLQTTPDYNNNISAQ